MSESKSKLSKWTRVFLFCSGADIKVIDSCPNVIAMKYAAMGGLVLTPAILATLSSFYFFQTIFEWKIWIAVCLSLLWGLCIFNIDRYLLISFQKKDTVVRDLVSFSVFSRVCIAGFFAYAIAHPLVLCMFRGNIDEFLSKHKMEKQETTRQYFLSKISDEESKIAQFNKAVAEKQSEISRRSWNEKERAVLLEEIAQSERDLPVEIAGKGVSGKEGDRAVAAAMRSNLEAKKQRLNEMEERNKDIAKKELEQLESLREVNGEQIAAAQNRIADYEKEMRRAVDGDEVIVATDFLARSNILEQLKSENFNIRKWDLLLTTLLMLLDVMPILWVAIPRKDAYELKVETKLLEIRTNELIEREAAEATNNDKKQLKINEYQYENTENELARLTLHKIILLKRYHAFSDEILPLHIKFQEKIKTYRNAADGEIPEFEQMSEKDLIDSYFSISDQAVADIRDVINRREE